MKHKPDWEIIQERYRRFWNDEEVDRCLLWTVSYRNDSDFSDSHSFTEDFVPNFDIQCEDLFKRWTDFDFLFSYHERYFSNFYYGAEALPVFWINLGPGVMAAYLGSKFEFRENTVWFYPILDSLNNFEPEIDEKNTWWNLTKDLTEKAAKQGKNGFLTGITDLGGVGDILAHLRGTANLCIDLVENKEIVKEIELKMIDLWIRCYKKLHQIISNNNGLVSHWLGTWAPGSHYPMQCDFSALISDTMFKEVFLPALQKQAEFLDFPIYHLDGPGAIKHLDSILEIEKIKAIQWVPGDGTPRVLHWLPLLQKIQKTGKKTIVYANPEEALELVKYLDYQKTLIFIDGIFNSEREMGNFIRLVKKNCYSKV